MKFEVVRVNTIEDIDISSAMVYYNNREREWTRPRPDLPFLRAVHMPPAERGIAWTDLQVQEDCFDGPGPLQFLASSNQSLRLTKAKGGQDRTWMTDQLGGRLPDGNNGSGNVGMWKLMTD
ncbi:hypothetical protein TWF106_003462 [Orbilia oligospora]|uniref:Uncharacterized protein n=1 Tax=Orbilia oligospora TaxID=2813651 RepID=A0A6G1MAS0_ORBOL|nr:hypothetical protein TWF679_002950 [Orbilia oligospora]KAF3200143.1 hypothetical protein TWF106_003462 [Orbilia oligospora]KAF3205215.1 hypothetical protein TWF191_001924 [Orbilia oligospora]KAF3251020.1 hypothetical protein TWF192_004998 [Orbilia oligospora]